MSDPREDGAGIPSADDTVDEYQIASTPEPDEERPVAEPVPDPEAPLDSPDADLSDDETPVDPFLERSDGS